MGSNSKLLLLLVALSLWTSSITALEHDTAKEPDTYEEEERLSLDEENPVVSGHANGFEILDLKTKDNDKAADGAIQKSAYGDFKSCVAGPFGGHGGRPFNDENYAKYGPVAVIKLYSNPYGRKQLTGIRLYYGAGKSVLHGFGNGKKCDTIVLHRGEFVNKIYGYIVLQTWDTRLYYVSALQFTTNRGRVFGMYGYTEEGIAFQAQGGRLRYISGTEGGLVDRLYFHFDQCKSSCY